MAREKYSQLSKRVKPYKYKESKQALLDGHDYVFWVEGESCADALWRLGLPAITILGGSKFDPNRDINLFKPEQIVLVPDLDSVGINYMRKVAGFYKGLIYCSSLGEAYEIADYFAVIVKERFGSELSLTVKRGCSEYSNAFPDYNKINRTGPQEMNYNPHWKTIEDDYDLKNPIKYEKIVWPSLSGLSLSDVLIMRNWIDYAKGIGDSSAQLLGQNGVVSTWGTS